LELNSSYLPAYAELANALYAAGDLTGVQDLIAEALGIFPGNFSLALLSGVFHHDSGKLDEALKSYHAAERMEPNHPELLERLANLYLLLQQPRQSADVLRRLSQATPDAAAVWAQLAFALAQIGETNEAQQALTRALEIDPNDVTVRQVARLLR
jgi:tetratricopeptide (TPR) repeat protein